jgi:hypothetical protein
MKENKLFFNLLVFISVFVIGGTVYAQGPRTPADLVPIHVAVPEEGQFIEYNDGSAICFDNLKCVKFPVLWSTKHKGPFLLELYDSDNKLVRSLLTHTDPPSPGTENYAAYVTFHTGNSTPGSYRIRVRTTIGSHSGISSKFILRHKLWEETIVPGYDNHFYKKITEYSLGMGFTTGTATPYSEKPGHARVGFSNYYETKGAEYIYVGYLFRSQVKFDLSHYKNRKGKLLEARLVMEEIEAHHSAAIDAADGTTRVYRLTQQWGQANFLDSPGTLVIDLPHQGGPYSIDILEWIQAWTDNKITNEGLLLHGEMESMNHDNLYFVHYYRIGLIIKFQEE